MLHIEVIPTEELGDRSYVAHDGSVAIVIDPQRDLDRVEELLAARGLTVGLVAETHIHNDYVTGGYELARRAGVPYVVNAADEVSFDRRAVSDGDELSVGSLTLRAVATPGHTDTHLSFVVTSSDGDGHAGPAVFTGGSLLFGSVGRTDLVDPARTEELTRAQYRSARRLADELPDETSVFPTHGFGSFCSSGPATGGDDSTIGVERTRNDALTVDDEDVFVERLVAGLTAYPAYYAHMAPLNRQGPGAPDLSPVSTVDADALRTSLSAGHWVVDLRDRTAYASEHLRGTVSIELGDQFATYLGWLIPWGTPLTLLGESAEQVAGAQRQLVRIGIERPAGAAIGEPASFAAAADVTAYERASFADVRSGIGDGDVVLDVRRDDERKEGYVTGSVHVPLNELLDRIDEVPSARLWVHCASGFRASIAASILDGAGRDVVHVDDQYDAAVEAGLTTEA